MTLLGPLSQFSTTVFLTIFRPTRDHSQHFHVDPALNGTVCVFTTHNMAHLYLDGTTNETSTTVTILSNNLFDL